MKSKMKIVDVGGGMRGVYAAQIFEFCLNTLKRKSDYMARLYEKGYFDGHKIVSFLTG